MSDDIEALAKKIVEDAGVSRPQALKVISLLRELEQKDPEQYRGLLEYCRIMSRRVDNETAH